MDQFKREVRQGRLGFDTQLAEELLGRPDLSHAQIKKQLGINAKVVRRVIKQFNIGARKRGPKSGPQPRSF